MKLPQRIQTPRLVLRRLTPGDQREFVALLTDPAGAAFMFRDAQKTVAGARLFLEEIISSYGTDAPYFVLAMEIVDTGGIIGVCGVSGLPDRNARELFCCVTPRRRRNGYALEALRRVMEYCSAEQGVTDFRAYIDPGNGTSASLAQRLGMRSAGEEPHPSDGSNCIAYSIVIR